MSEEASATLDEIAEKAASKINYIRVILLVTLIVTIGLGVIVSTYLVRSVTGPIERLVGATRIIASGNLEHRIQEEKEAEFAELARHFNAMSAALEKTYESLRSANEELRREIRDGTRARREREELQEQLLHARKMQALGTLSAGIAHEFGNFLQIIQGCVARLATKADARAPGRREIDTIGDTARKGADLTRRLLTFGSKLESMLLPTDINERVRHAKTIFEKTLPRSIEVRTSLAEGILPVAADPAQIEQVLLNLALNARDAMPDGGVLHIETSRDTDGSRLEATAEPEEWIVIKVSDTGHGMDEETVRHIFDPFFTTKKVGVGTGLGLATAYGIVTSHGGEISCKSEVGRGTVFETRLPAMFETSQTAVAGDAAAPGAAETTKRDTPRESETILWVDDEVAMLEVMSDNLEEYGYAIHTADSGEKALELFREHAGAIDLVVLDLGMPGMGGRVCLEKLLEIDPDARVIITTGFGTQEEEEEMTRAGARGFLAKPAQISEILSKIEEVLST
jgi:signal transduction histidine kinase/CheY-like chemotaxis protein